MWIYQGTIVGQAPENKIGFVYLITNNKTGKKYLGKKRLTFIRYKQIKGKRKKYKIESDWRDYFGSSKELLEDLEKIGPENFSREILRFCDSLGECSYFESKLQFEYGVLETDGWYNGQIMCRIHKKHLTFLKKSVDFK